MIVIAPNDRKYRVEVGTGLEGDLTDADASILARESLVSAFRAGDYTGGIENLTQAIESHLGVMTPEQRTVFRRNMEEKERRDADAAGAKAFDFWATVGIIILTTLGVIALFIFILNITERVKALIRRIRRRKELRKALALIQPELERLMTERSAIDLPNLPTWMQDDKEEIGGRFGSRLERVLELRKEIRPLIKDDIWRAEELKRELDQALKSAESALGELRAIPEQVRVFRHETEQVVLEACSEIDALVTRTNDLARKRYQVEDIVPALDTIRLTNEKKSIEALLANRGEGPVDASDVVNDKATRLLAKVRSLREALESVIETQSLSKRRIATLQKRAQAFPSLLAEHRARLERLRKIAPRNRWADLEEDLPVFERTLGGIVPRLEVAIHANSMDTQLFTKAAETLTAAEAALGVVDSSMKRAEVIESEIAGAQRGYPNQLRDVQNAIVTAKRVMADSAVGPGAKSRLSEAQRFLESIQVSAALVDWIGVNELLQQALAKAKQAKQLAESDIDTAARELRRRRDEETRRQRLASEASAASVYSSTFGGGGGGVSFGGGTFGGGGASGDW